VGTGVPGDFPLPQRHYAPEALREEARGYVLELSMNAQVGGGQWWSWRGSVVDLAGAAVAVRRPCCCSAAA
jgi:hypothetical protein